MMTLHTVLAACSCLLPCASAPTVGFADAGATTRADAAPGPSALAQRFSALRAAFLEQAAQEKLNAATVSETWSVVAEWTLETLRTHPSVPARELASLVEGLAGPASDASPETALSVCALQLQGGEQAAYVVSAELAAAGTFFVLARDKDDWRMAWSMWEVGVRNFEQRNELGRWAYLERGFHDGRLLPELYPVPATTSGQPRFLVAGVANPMMGGDGPIQIGVWAWDGRTLRSQFLRCAVVSIDFDWSVRRQEDRVLVHTKEPLKSLVACGMCPDLESIWTLDLSGDEVVDLGRRPVDPALAAVDELLDAVRRGLPTAKLASPAAVGALRAVLPREPDAFLGMFSHTAEPGPRGTVRLHLQADELLPLEFTLDPKGGRHFVVAVKRERSKSKSPR